jgi:charged multivesicular body protein 5
MDRLFGKSKPAAPKPTLQDAHDSMEKRGEGIDQKIMKLDKELGCVRTRP